MGYSTMLRNKVRHNDRVYWTTQENCFKSNWYKAIPEARLLGDILDSHMSRETHIIVYGVLTEAGLFHYVTK